MSNKRYSPEFKEVAVSDLSDRNLSAFSRGTSATRSNTDTFSACAIDSRVDALGVDALVSILR